MEDLIQQAKETDFQEDTSKSMDILTEYYAKIDPNIRKLKWGYKPAKSVDFGKTDQSLLNHIRNGVTFLSQLQDALQKLDRDFSDSKLRKSLGLFVVHDVHKLEESSREEEFDIEKDKVEKIVEELGLKDFCNLGIEDYYSSVKAAHKSDNAKIGRLTPDWGQLSAYVRLADSMASSPTPEDAASSRSHEVLEEEFENLEFRYHRLREEKGILTNIVNRSVAKFMVENGRYLLTIYSDGCVYITEKEDKEKELNQENFQKILATFMDSIKDAHDNFSDPSKLSESINSNHLGLYSVSKEYFFYTGIERIARGLVFKGITDAEKDSNLSDSMISDIETASEASGIEIDESREIIGYGRTVTAVYREILSEEMSLEEGLQALGRIFNAKKAAKNLIHVGESEHDELIKGGKWSYGLAIAQEFLDSQLNGKKINDYTPIELSKEISDRITDEIEEKETLEKMLGDFKKEVKAYLADIIVLNNSDYPFDQPDIFKEYTGKRRSKVCNICNRSTFGNKGDMETKNSDTGLQAGFSNFKKLGKGKPEKQILCKPCQIEFGLRKISGDFSADYQIFYHLIPDYFYTPESWQLAENIVQEIGNGRLQLERIAEKTLNDEFLEADKYFENIKEGNNFEVINSTIGEFKNNFGVQILEYKRNESRNSKLNDTSVHFLSIFTGIVTAQLSGSRLVVSEKPVNTEGSYFKELAKIDCGKSQVFNVTGETVSIKRPETTYKDFEFDSELEAKLKAFASLIRLGYSVERKDSMFAKYLRICRNSDLPGSKLLKMYIRDSSPENAGFYLEETEIIDKVLGDTMVENKLDHLSELGYRVAIPKSYKAYAVERPFREAVKAITETDKELGKEDYKNLVSGRLRKGLERTDQTFSKSKDDFDTEKGFGERVDEFAKFFVEEIFYDLCDGKPGKLKRKSNNFADAYYSGILKRKNSDEN